MRVLYRRRDDGLRSSAWHDSSRGASSGAPTRHSRGSSTDGRSGADPSYRRPLLKASAQHQDSTGCLTVDAFVRFLRLVRRALRIRYRHPIAASHRVQDAGSRVPNGASSHPARRRPYIAADRVQGEASQGHHDGSLRSSNCCAVDTTDGFKEPVERECGQEVHGEPLLDARAPR